MRISELYHSGLQNTREGVPRIKWLNQAKYPDNIRQIFSEKKVLFCGIGTMVWTFWGSWCKVKCNAYHNLTDKYTLYENEVKEWHRCSLAALIQGT